MIAVLGAVGDAHGAASVVPRLVVLVTRARLVATGMVSRVDGYDEGRISVARVVPDRVLKGPPGSAEIAVVEEHYLPSSVPLLQPGAHVAVFLQRAERTSALARALPPGPQYWRLLDGPAGFLATSDAEAGREAASLVLRITEGTGDTTRDPAARAEKERALVFDELAARHSRLVADGAAALTSVPDLATTLRDDERNRVERALQRTDLPEWTQLALIEGVAAARLVQLVPTLRALPRPSPAMLATSWRALARLGHPVSAKDLAAYTTAPDPAIRAVVPAALLAAAGDDAVPQVERMALQDADIGVRGAAVEALGATKRDSVVPSLERVYRAGPTALRRAAAAAYIAVGSRAAAESAARLVFEAPADTQRGAVTILLAVVGKDDPLVAKIRTNHPDPDIRQLIEHGAEMGHQHPG